MNLNKIVENFTYLDIPICAVNCSKQSDFTEASFIPAKNSLPQNVNNFVWSDGISSQLYNHKHSADAKGEHIFVNIFGYYWRLKYIQLHFFSVHGCLMRMADRGGSSLKPFGKWLLPISAWSIVRLCCENAISGPLLAWIHLNPNMDK